MCCSYVKLSSFFPSSFSFSISYQFFLDHKKAVFTFNIFHSFHIYFHFISLSPFFIFFILPSQHSLFFYVYTHHGKKKLFFTSLFTIGKVEWEWNDVDVECSSHTKPLTLLCMRWEFSFHFYFHLFLFQMEVHVWMWIWNWFVLQLNIKKRKKELRMNECGKLKRMSIAIEV